MDANKLRAELQAKQAREASDLEAKIDTLAAIPDDLHHLDWFTHSHTLYGVPQSLRATLCRYSSLPGKSATFADLLRIAEVFPAVDTWTVHKTSTTAIMPKAYYDSLPESDIDPRFCGPLRVSIDPGISQTLSFEWTARVARNLTHIEVKFALYGPEARKLGNLDITWSHTNPRYDESRRVERNRFRINSNMEVVGSTKAFSITFASGDPKIPGRHEILWETFGAPAEDVEGNPLTILDYLKLWQ